MSLAAFESFRAKHPDQADLVAAAERCLQDHAREQPGGLVDELAIAQQLRGDLQVIKRLFVALAEAELLQPLFVWNCPNGGGTCAEAADLRELPPVLDCDRCGQHHVLHSRDVEVQFLLAPLARAARDSG
jgi:hypothetical protein